MALIQSSRQSAGAGGGGGGMTITGFANNQFVQASNFISGAVTLALSNVPLTPTSLQIDYNGQRLLFGSSWSIVGSTVTILFADPYVTDYDTPPVFQATYPY